MTLIVALNFNLAAVDLLSTLRQSVNSTTSLVKIVESPSLKVWFHVQ